MYILSIIIIINRIIYQYNCIIYTYAHTQTYTHSYTHIYIYIYILSDSVNVYTFSVYYLCDLFHIPH